MYLTFYQIIHYGISDPDIDYALLEGLYHTYMMSDKTAQPDIKEFFNYVYTLINQQNHFPLDKERFDSIFRELIKDDKDTLNLELNKDEA